MKWIGIGVMSAIMGVFLAVMAQTAFPALTEAGFTAAAVLASAVILAILVRLTVTRARSWSTRRRNGISPRS